MSHSLVEVMTSIFKHNATQIPILQSKFHVLRFISRTFDGFFFFDLYLQVLEYGLKYCGSKNFEGCFADYVDS